MIASVPWDLAPHLPWQVVSSPAEQWAELPSFLIGEILFIALALLGLVHARRNGPDHLLIWIGALIAGTANDMIFMALPLVDNFWQAQAVIMLTPRLPLYIPCVYVCFMYFPTVAVRRLRLPPWSQAALTGLTAMLFYAPYDIVGAKFLWWTWHDTDLPIAARILGAPVGSSLWVLTFVGAFGWLMHRAITKHGIVHASADGLAPRVELGAKGFAWGLAAVAGLTTLCMMLQMTVLQQLDGGAPAYRAFIAGIVIYLIVVARGFKRAAPEAPRRSDRIMVAGVAGYFATLTLIMAVFTPETHVSTGTHQVPGPCYVEVKDITGLTRHQYLCASDFDEDYSFECVDELPADHAEWYTVCGKPHSSFPTWMGGISALGAAGIALFFFLLGPLRRRRS